MQHQSGGAAFEHQSYTLITSHRHIHHTERQLHHVPPAPCLTARQQPPWTTHKPHAGKEALMLAAGWSCGQHCPSHQSASGTGHACRNTRTAAHTHGRCSRHSCAQPAGVRPAPWLTNRHLSVETATQAGRPAGHHQGYNRVTPSPPSFFTSCTPAQGQQQHSRRHQTQPSAILDAMPTDRSLAANTYPSL